MRRFMVPIAGFFALTTASLAGVSDIERSPNETGPSSAGAFNRWLFTSDAHQLGWKAQYYAGFQGFLEREGVAGVVPTWQLWRVDAQYASHCGSDYFAVIPEDRWHEILPTLKLLRDEVIPVTGPLEVVSAYRTPQINRCVNGASQSRHLSFSALDLVATDRSDRHRLFADLCAMHRRVGRATGMGLGAYFDPKDSERGASGRFHIDAAGFRDWGFDYTAKSSPCPLLN
jgi:hypothetical protein